MNPKLRMIFAIIGLVFFVAGAVFMTIYFYNAKLLGGMVGYLSMAFYGVGLVFYFAILVTKSLPSQQLKEEKKRKLEEEYYKKLEELEAEKEKSPSLDTKNEND